MSAPLGRCCALAQNYQPPVPATPYDFGPHVGKVAANEGSRGYRRRLAPSRRAGNLLNARLRDTPVYRRQIKQVWAQIVIMPTDESSITSISADSIYKTSGRFVDLMCVFIPD
jgi:hypothetical protein